jgi:thiazole/oxazole-forming peptide maturase SagD family component
MAVTSMAPCDEWEQAAFQDALFAGDTTMEPIRPAIDFEKIAQALVSDEGGIVRNLSRVEKLLDEPELPIIVSCELAQGYCANAEAPIACAGKGMTESAAAKGAIAEALERYAGLTWIPQQQVRAVRSDLTGRSLDPRELILFSDDQYSRLPYGRYETDAPIDWVAARSLVAGDTVWVPSLAVRLDYQATDSATCLFRPSSNGMAAGSTIADAILRGLLEVVERDAFMVCWANRWPGRRSRASEVPDPLVRTIAAAYERRGIRVSVYALPTDTVPVVMAIAWSKRRPGAIVGLGADLDQQVAARHAVFEMAQLRAGIGLQLQWPETISRVARLIGEPSSVREPQDHALLYVDPDSAHRGLHHLFDAPEEVWDSATTMPTITRDAALKVLVALLAANSFEPLYVDMTPLDVSPLGLHIVRAIVPGYQPIDFGAEALRLGGVRLHSSPALMSLLHGMGGSGGLNLAPHPLS